MEYPKEFFGQPLVQRVIAEGNKREVHLLAAQVVWELHRLWGAYHDRVRWNARNIDEAFTWVQTVQGSDFWIDAHYCLFSSEAGYLNRCKEQNQAIRPPLN